MRASEAPWYTMREILVVTPAYACTSLWGRGRGVPRQPDGWWRMPSFLGGKSPGVLLGGNHMTSVAFEKEVFPLENIIYKWKKKVQWNTELSFWWKVRSSTYEFCLRGLHLCCVLPRTRLAYRWSSQHLAKVSTPNAAELMPSGFFFLSTTMAFAAVRTHFPRRNVSVIMSIGILSRGRNK